MAHLRLKGKRYYAEFYDPDRHPKRKWISLNTSDKRTAQQKLTKLERQFAMELKDPWTMRTDQEGVTIKDAKDQFLRSRKGRSKKTIENYDLVLSLFERTLAPDFQARHVEQRHVETFLDGQKINQTSRGTYFRHLRAFFRWSLKEGLIERNPIADMPPPRRSTTIAEFLMPEQVDKLIKHIEDDIKEKGGYVQPGQVSWLPH